MWLRPLKGLGHWEKKNPYVSDEGEDRDWGTLDDDPPMLKGIKWNFEGLAERLDANLGRLAGDQAGHITDGKLVIRYSIQSPHTYPIRYSTTVSSDSAVVGPLFVL